MKILLLLVSFCYFQFGFSQIKEPIKVTDLAKIKQVNQVTISRDGSMTAFVVNSIELEKDNKWEYKYLNQIYLVPTNGTAAPRALTTKESAASPCWHPNGKQIAFVRTVDGKPQIFSLSLEGGEPVQVTKFKYGAANPKWSPDGNKLLFTAAIGLQDLLTDKSLNPNADLPAWPFEKPGFEKNEHLAINSAKPNPDGSLAEMRAYLQLNALDKKAKVINKLNFQEETTTSSEQNFTHVFIMQPSTNTEPLDLTPGFYRFSNADFSSDGKQVLFTGDKDDLEHPDKSLESSIFIVDVDGKNWRTLLSKAGVSFSSPKLSPSGKWLAYQYGNTSFVDVPNLAIMPIDGHHNIRQEIPFNRNKNNLIWSEDENYLYFSAPSNGAVPIYRANLKTKQVSTLTNLTAGINSFDLNKNQLWYAKTTVANPFELYQADALAKNEKRISDFNQEWINQKQLSFPEAKTFVNDKGTSIEYWVMKPANFETGKKYPAILNIHGGPSAMWGPGESSMWHEFQYYCAKGYVVVYANPRGSGGYGAEFLRENINDWGKGPSSDVLTALDKTIEEGFIDKENLAVTGGSYAGYLVAWIVSHDQRFKAACAQRGVYELGTFFGEGNAWRLVPNYFGGYPWEKPTREIIQRESPINYVDQIKTPLLIFHGENDLRTGVIQSEMLYKSLKVLGSPVEYVRHPGGTHELTRSGNNRQRIDQMLRTMEFFERFIKH